MNRETLVRSFALRKKKKKECSLENCTPLALETRPHLLLVSDQQGWCDTPRTASSAPSVCLSLANASRARRQDGPGSMGENYTMFN